MTIETLNPKIPIFLGLTAKAARRGHAWDLIGLSRLILFPFFPQNLSGLQCLLGLHRDLIREGTNVSYRTILTDLSNPKNKAWNDQSITLEAKGDKTDIPVNPGGFSIKPILPKGDNSTIGWGLLAASQPEPASYELLPHPSPPLVLMGPTEMSIDIEIDGREEHLGEFVCAFVPTPPLTADERRAIAARPGAASVIGINIECQSCKEKIEVYTTLEAGIPKPEKLSKKAIDISVAPSQWVCSCGTITADLTYLKQGLHELFRHSAGTTIGEFSLQYTPLYEAHRIATILETYEGLIARCPQEEEVQKFLEGNPIFWAFLSPVRIMHKPPVLTKKVADFGIVNAQRVLYLIEIEKPSTRLSKKDDSIAADIQKGVNQIRDWSLVVDDHRAALLSELGLSDLGIREVRYILIGGMSSKTSTVGLIKLRRAELAPKTQFFCFDELGSFLRVVAAELSRI